MSQVTYATATASPLGEDRYALSFELHNSGAEAVHVASYEPFLEFEVVVNAEGGTVPVDQPALDIGVREVTIVVPGSGSTLLHTPVQLRIQGGSDAGSDGLLWTVPCHRDSVELEVRLFLPAPFDLTCPLDFAPYQPSGLPR